MKCEDLLIKAAPRIEEAKQKAVTLEAEVTRCLNQKESIEEALKDDKESIQIATLHLERRIKYYKSELRKEKTFLGEAHSIYEVYELSGAGESCYDMGDLLVKNGVVDATVLEDHESSCCYFSFKSIEHAQGFIKRLNEFLKLRAAAAHVLGL